MPKMACMDCGAVVYEADSLREMLVKMIPHYLEAHRDIVSGTCLQPRSTWMARFTAAFQVVNDEHKTSP